MPVTVKDVAGLVPGAYEGKGRGNRSVSDLVQFVRSFSPYLSVCPSLSLSFPLYLSTLLSFAPPLSLFLPLPPPMRERDEETGQSVILYSL